MHSTFLSTLLLGTFLLGGPGAASPSSRAANADIVFADDFEGGNLNQWSIQACPGGAAISVDVARTGNHSVKFVVNDGDTNAKCPDVPTDNPRAQLVSPGLFKDGDEFFVGLSIFFPTGFPQPKDWFQLAELYGPPFNGSPTMGLDLCNGNQMCFVRDQSNNNDQIWMSAPIQPNAWRDIVLHVKFSTDAAQGFVEIWDGGVLQQLANNQTRINYMTLNPQVNWNGTPNSLFINQYRSSDEKLGTVTLYHDAVKVGTTLQSVQIPPLGNGSTGVPSEAVAHGERVKSKSSDKKKHGHEGSHSQSDHQ